MTNERDPQLEALFADLDDASPNGDFADRVMSRVDVRKRNVLIGRLSIVVLIVALELLLSAPLTGTLAEIVNGLSTPIFDLGSGWLASILGPINSAAGVVGVILLLLHYIYRSLMR